MLEYAIKNLVLDYFSVNKCNVIEKNGLFDVHLTQDLKNEFRNDWLKITFDEELARTNNYDLITPGNNILFKIINYGIKLGPVLSCILKSSPYENVMRFYFYMVYESVKSQTQIKWIDVDVKSLRIVNIDDKDMVFEQEIVQTGISLDSIDDCYIAATEYLEKLTKTEINNFKNEIFDMRQIEIDNLDRLRSKQLSEIGRAHV